MKHSYFLWNYLTDYGHFFLRITNNFIFSSVKKEKFEKNSTFRKEKLVVRLGFFFEKKLPDFLYIYR